MSSDGPASVRVAAVETTFLNLLSATGECGSFCGYRVLYRQHQTPRRGDRLLGPATAAKEEAALHRSNSKSALQDRQISIDLVGADLLAVLSPLSALIAKHIFKNWLPQRLTNERRTLHRLNRLI